MESVFLRSAVTMDLNRCAEALGQKTRMLRRADDMIRLAAAAASLACKEAGRDAPCPHGTGLVVGTSFGAIETNFRFLDTLDQGGEGQASPTLFSHSVHNAAAGYISRLMDIKGPTATVTSFAWPLISALQHALVSISSGGCERAIVVAAEVQSPLLDEARARMKGSPSEGGGPSRAVAWLLDREGHQGEERPLLDKADVSERCGDPVDFLTRESEEITTPQGTLHHPGHQGEYMIILTEAVMRKEFGRFVMKADFGEAELVLKSPTIERSGP